MDRRYRDNIHRYRVIINVKAYLFSRNVLALETFFPIAEAFQEKYEPDGSTYSKNKLHQKATLNFPSFSLRMQ
jgi:hypothetical protein